MSYKLGLMLSLLYMMSTILLGGDIYALIAVRNHLDDIALTVAFRISKEGYVSPSTKQFIEDEGAYFRAITNITPRVGDTYVFEIYKEYEPIIIKKSTMEVAVRRTTVVGFYETN